MAQSQGFFQLTLMVFFGNFKGMKAELAKSYNPADYEDKIYQKWEASGFFNPDNLKLPANAPDYTIILPPPNITDKLHVGHSLMLAIEDLLIRYQRLRGARALWLPGTDHAAIATQNVVEKKLLQEKGQARQELGREKFLAEVWQFVNSTQATILKQTRKMGASLDWSRLAFTLDDERQGAVRTMFREMYEAGAIYRGERIVNWCPRCHSTLADDEVEYKEEKAKLYWLKYGPFILATSRPETKLGDTAVAVHPDDPRYQSLVGQEIEVEGVLGKFKVQVVADTAVDRDFGSGAIKVTPAHSFVDNEIAKRHNLPSKKIIDEDGRMMANCGQYAGFTTKAAREMIVADMEKMGLIDHIDEDYSHNASVCYRCGTVIEPLPSRQWFVAVDKPLERLGNKSLKARALEVVQEGQIRFIPERFHKRYIDWMENLHDWCISRQIWFGHQIPVWYKGEAIAVGVAPSEDGWSQDQDTLDTWFSSGMWTFSTLGWPRNFINGQKQGDLASFHPTQVLETGSEILTLWVSRMIMMSLFALDEIPFSTVYLHGTVLDKNGKKMSKSKGNGVDPVDMIEKFGTDALRLSLLTGATPGNANRFSEDRVEAKRNFVNKLWNIARYILSSVPEDYYQTPADKLPGLKTVADKWIIGELAQLIRQATKNLDNYEFSAAAEALEEFTWNKLADWYLEIAKIEKDKEEILIYILKNLLILWQPFAPFITEVLNEQFSDNLLMIAAWPEALEVPGFAKAAPALEKVIAAVKDIRDARSQNKIEPARKLSVKVYSPTEAELFSTQAELIKNLKTGISDLEIISAPLNESQAIKIISGTNEIYLLGAIDPEKEQKRLAKERDNLARLVANLEAKLANPEFKQKAPAAIVVQEEGRLAAYKAEWLKLNNS